MKKLVVLFIGVILILASGCAGYEPEIDEEPAVVISEVETVEEDPLEVPETEEKTELTDDEEEIQAEANAQLVREAAVIAGVEAEADGKNVVLTIDDKILFDLLSAEIKRTAMPALDEVAKLLLDYPDRMVLVGGHADTLPTLTEQFPSNWDLSAQRAVNVVKYISHLPGLDNSRLIAAGFGEYHPVAPNDTPENRAKNRRVEIILLPPGLDQKKIQLAH